MFKKVLICTDLSDASSVLLTCAMDLKSIGVEEAILNHVVYDAIPGGMDEAFLNETKPIHKDHGAVKKLLPLLEKQKAVLEEAGIKVNIEMVHGIPARAINDVAEEHEVSAIVMGSHGKGIFKRATIGSVSAEVIHLARKPVLLVRSKLGKANEVVLACKRLFNHILYLTDFSETAQKSLDYLEEIVKQSKCKVSILHIQDFVKIDNYLHNVPELDPKLFIEVEAQNLKKIQSDLEAIKERLTAAGSTMVNYEYPKGRPIDVVMDRIKENNDLSLVVMGSQGKGFAKELFLGSLSLQVSRYSPIPVLLIPAKITK